MLILSTMNCPVMKVFKRLPDASICMQRTTEFKICTTYYNFICILILLKENSETAFVRSKIHNFSRRIAGFSPLFLNGRAKT
jgi:hypothetical protein